ncbi:MAG: hypothetical protein DRI36_04845 [Caldiserica bacterium]|nr:MAG: hypothetical protein DRI36_04845 [Caldisericota bacterium]
MLYKRFEDLPIWKSAFEIVVRIYKETEKIRDFTLKDHLRRTALSIPSNIAEGFERGSSKEFMRFLFIAKGSSGELRTQLRIAQQMGFFSSKKCKELISDVENISRQIMGLIESIKKRKLNK